MFSSVGGWRRRLGSLAGILLTLAMTLAGLGLEPQRRRDPCGRRHAAGRPDPPRDGLRRRAADRADQRRRVGPGHRRQPRLRHRSVHLGASGRRPARHRRDAPLEHPCLRPHHRCADHVVGPDPEPAGPRHHRVRGRPTIYVGGDFDQVNGQWIGRVAALNAQTGALVPGFNPGANTRVRALARQWQHALRRRLLHDVRRSGALPPRRGRRDDRRAAALGSVDGPEVVSMVATPTGGRVIIGGNFSTHQRLDPARHGLGRRRHGRGDALGREPDHPELRRRAWRSTR